MKKKLNIITASILLGVLAFSFTQHKTFSNLVNKDINVEVYKAASYVSQAYAHAYVSLEVIVLRIRGNKRDTAWQHTFQPKGLKEYPSFNKPMVQKITIPNVNNCKEKLEICYKLTYDSQGSILKFLNTAIIGKGQQTDKLHIQI